MSPARQLHDFNQAYLKPCKQYPYDSADACRFLHALRRGFVLQCEDELHNVTEMEVSHVNLIRLALKQISRSALKELEGNRMDIAAITAAKAQVKRCDVCAHLCSMYRLQLTRGCAF